MDRAQPHPKGTATKNEEKWEQRGSVVFHNDFFYDWTILLPKQGTKLPLTQVESILIQLCGDDPKNVLRWQAMATIPLMPA